MDGMEIQRTLLLGYVLFPQAKSYRNQRLLKTHQNISIQNAVTLSKNTVSLQKDYFVSYVRNGHHILSDTFFVLSIELRRQIKYCKCTFHKIRRKEIILIHLDLFKPDNISIHI